MSTEANKALLRRVTDAMRARDWDALRKLIPPENAVGLETDPFIIAFPDTEIIIDDLLADGDKVISRWTDLGTHTGPYKGIPPTGRRIRVSGISIDRIENGRIVETWHYWDELGLLHQLGVSSIPADESSPNGSK